MRFFIPLLFTLITLTGCRSNKEANVRLIVSSVGAATLVSDAANLARQPAPEDGSPESISFRAFNPIETWRYGQQFIIVTERHLQHRVGVAIQPIDHPEPTNIGGSRYVWIAPGIYFYEN